MIWDKEQKPAGGAAANKTAEVRGGVLEQTSEEKVKNVHLLSVFLFFVFFFLKS